MTTLRVLGTAALYGLVALVVTGPALRAGALLGHPGVDVYNHAWGAWWWAAEAARGALPWQTDLLLHPRGAVLWYIDPVGALLSQPVLALAGHDAAGVALAWNLLATFRVALAGFAAHLLCVELTRKGPHAFVAGLAHLFAPFLLCELYDGIAEATGTGFVALAWWGWARALRLGTAGAHAVAGLLTGLAAAGSFYFGLAILLPLVPVLLVALVRRRQRIGPVLAGAVATALVAVPPYLAMRASFLSPLAALPRHGGQNLALIRHNAVDPRELVVPGFQSFDFAAAGELFLHSTYLRLSVLALVLVALVRFRHLRWPWIWVAAASLAAALGPYLVVGGDLVRVAGGVVPLPFMLLQVLVPELAITHAARLGVSGVAVTCALAGAALAPVDGARFRHYAVAAVAAAVVVAESLWASPARLPLPTAPARIPAAVTALAAATPDDRRGVLDLPPQVGWTMHASRHLWYQIAHRRPIPWGPDPHLSRAGDNDLALSLDKHRTGRPSEAPLSLAALQRRLAEQYAWIVVHDDLEALDRGPGDTRPPDPAGTPGPYARWVVSLFGQPTVKEGPIRAWRLDPP